MLPPVIIYAKNRKSLHFGLGALLVLVSVTWVIIFLTDVDTVTDRGYLRVAFVVFFLLRGIFLLVKAFRKRPGLLIDDSGVTDYALAHAPSVVLWHEVERIAAIESNGRKLIGLFPAPPTYNSPPVPPKQKRLREVMLKRYGTLQTINPAGLEPSVEPLEALLERYRAANPVYLTA